MEYFAIAVLLIIFILAILARKEEVPKECEPSTVTEPFFKIGAWLDRRLRAAPEKLRSRVFQKNEEKLRLLEPAADIARLSSVQFISKTGLTVLFLAVGMLLGLILSYRESQESVFNADGSLPRREWGEGSYRVQLKAESEEESRDQELLIEERKFTTEEIQAMLPAFHEALTAAVLKKNKSADHVDSDIELPESISGYPFAIAWEYDRRDAIRRDGKLKDAVPTQGVPVNLTAISEYGDFSELYEFSIMVYPYAEETDSFAESIGRALLAANEASSTAKSFVLPPAADGIALSWSEKKSRSMAMLILFVPIAAAAIVWGKDNDLDKRIKERDTQMAMDYPEMVSKLSLYIGAGMSTRVAWKKICADYVKKAEKRYVYEEMLLSVREMESGVSELAAYQHFARRCRLQKYVKLVSLLEQNARMGAAGLLSSLRAESRDALQERKTTARRLGEEAGTKLLLPMILMLAIVMVVIIVPAFVSI